MRGWECKHHGQAAAAQHNVALSALFCCQTWVGLSIVTQENAFLCYFPLCLSIIITSPCLWSSWKHCPAWSWSAGGAGVGQRGGEVPRLHVDEAFMNILHEMYHISMIYQSSPLPPIYQVFWPGLPPAISCGYHNGAVCSPSSRADTFKTILCSARVKWGSPVHFYFCPSVEAAGVIVLDLHCCNLLFNLSPQFEQN